MANVATEQVLGQHTHTHTHTHIPVTPLCPDWGAHVCNYARIWLGFVKKGKEQCLLFTEFLCRPKDVLILRATEEDLIILRDTRYGLVLQYVIKHGRSDAQVTRFTVCMFWKFSAKPCVTPISLPYFETHCRDWQERRSLLFSLSSAFQSKWWENVPVTIGF